MKKFSKIVFKILVLSLVGIGIFLAGRYKSPTKVIANTADKIQLDNYKEKERQQQIENERLKNITTQNLINSELHKTDKHVLLETITTWQGVIPKQAFISWFDNNLHLEIPYTVQIQYDTSQIKTTKVDNNTVYVNANIKDQFKIMVILDSENIKQAKDKGWYAVEFTSEDLANILKTVQSEIENKYINDEDVYNQCVDRLQEYIVEIGKMFDREVEVTLINE